MHEDAGESTWGFQFVAFAFVPSAKRATHGTSLQQFAIEVLESTACARGLVRAEQRAAAEHLGPAQFAERSGEGGSVCHHVREKVDSDPRRALGLSRGQRGEWAGEWVDGWAGGL